MFGFGKKVAKQWVCTVCGYNAVGARPERCPFCGGQSGRILDSATISRRYRVTATPVSATVQQLKSSPRLGLEHAAYSIEADGGRVWIDCPAVFTEDLPAVDAILFTHKDFIGAANQYKQLWEPELWLHEADAELSEAAAQCVNKKFSEPVDRFGLRGIHIGGHSPGFTVYVWEDVLFVCDYAYPPGNAMKLNPHGNREATHEGAGRLADAVFSGDLASSLSTVCGYNYVVNFADWQKAFARLL